MTSDAAVPSREDESALAAVAALRSFAAAAQAPEWLEEPLGIRIDVDAVLFQHRKRFGRRARRQQRGVVEFELTWRGSGTWPELLRDVYAVCGRVEERAAFIQAVRGEDYVLVTATLGTTDEFAHGHVLRFRLVGRRVRKVLQRARQRASG